MITGIINYATDKLNIREGDPLFLLPRLNDTNIYRVLKPSLIKRSPEWWIGSEIVNHGSIKIAGEPVLETFMFWIFNFLIVYNIFDTLNMFKKLTSKV